MSAAALIDFVGKYEGRTLNLGILTFYRDNALLQPRLVTDETERLKQKGRGRPCSVLYTTTDLILVRWMVRLTSEGISVKKYAGALKALRRLLPDALKAPEKLRFFLLDREREVGVSIDGTAIQLSGDVGQVLLTFPMSIATDTISGLEMERRARMTTGGQS